jgi:sigma-B regulation protein RsbU (phosphoserine phosphatase)
MEEINQLNTRLSAQFEEVARVQRSLLPRVMPDIPGLDLATSYLTSDEAGGDYYDFFRLPGGCWGILIADVSGHGAAAATVMAMLHGILHAFVGATSTIPAPDEVMRYANGRLLEAGLESSFVTAFFAIYNPETSVLRFARAGHNPPIVKRPDRGCVELDSDRAGPPLGVFEPYEVACEEVRLDPGDTLVLYTDGITEAFSASREMFTAAKLMDAISRVSCHPDAVIDAVHQSLFKHTGGARTRADDQTLVVLRRRGGA